MSVKYSIAELKNPLRPEDPAKFYAKAQMRSEISLKRVARTLARQSTVTEGDTYNVLVNLPIVISEFLADGDMVNLGDLGKFQYQVSSIGADTRDGFTHANIQKVKFQFRPSKDFCPAFDKLEFEEVIPLKDQQEAKKKVKGR